MFSGINDTKKHADALVRLLSGLECRINLIRFHKIPDSDLLPSPMPVIETFKKRLNDAGIITTLRASRGEDVLAACGMLAGK
jgi:23S rRNA (adenine2503-C2)-methyltransferase